MLLAAWIIQGRSLRLVVVCTGAFLSDLEPSFCAVRGQTDGQADGCQCEGPSSNAVVVQSDVRHVTVTDLLGSLCN